MGVKLRERKGKGWYVMTDWKGQRKSKFFGKDKKFAKAFADKLAAKLKWAEESGEPFSLSRPDQEATPTLKDFLEDWLQIYAEVHTKPNTVRGYRQSLVNHILPALGQRQLKEVTRSDIKRLIATLSGQGLKKQTIHNILLPLKEAYNHAIDDGLVLNNPVARTGRLTRSREDQRRHIVPLTEDEVLAFLLWAQTNMPLLYPLFLCAVRTGLRQSELIGLHQGDIDFKGGFIEVRRAVVRGRLTDTKSHKIRRVDHTPQLAHVLQKHFETRRLESAMQGEKAEHEEPEWAFQTPSRTRWDESYLRKAFHRCLKQAGIRQVRFHDLRHTYASQLIRKGANPKYIQEQMGHSSIQVTMDTYGHLFGGEYRHLASRLDDPRLDQKEAESATQAQPALVDEGKTCVNY